MSSKDYRTRIIETAIRLFNTYGCKEVTMDQISTTLRISKRTLYETIPGKEALIMECLTEVYHRIGQQKIEMFHEADDHLLMTLFIIKTAVLHNEKYHRFLQDADRYYPQLNETLTLTFSKKIRGILRDIFETAEKNGDLRKNVDIDNAVNTISMSMLLWNNNCNKKTGNVKFEVTMSDSIYTYLRGLLSIPAIERYDKREEEFQKMLEIHSTDTES